MAEATLRVTINKRATQNALDRILAAAEHYTPDAVQEVADQSRNEMIRLLNLKSHPPGTKTPSLPGEPPARISGALSRSVHSTHVERTGAWRWEARARPTNPPIYGRIQELGGVTGRGHRTHLPPRPYASRALAELHAVGLYHEVPRSYWRAALEAGRR